MILVDAMMQIFRCAYSLTDLQNLDGKPTGMEFGFLMSMESLRRYFKDEVILCWEGRNNFRYDIDPNYKSSRKKKRLTGERAACCIGNRLGEFKDFCKLVAENAEQDTLEGDDVIATLAERYSQTEPVIIYSGDKDLHQCIRDPEARPHPEPSCYGVVQVKAYQFRTKPWDSKRLAVKYYGLKPASFNKWQAWCGDKQTDDVPGCGARGSRIAEALNLGYDGYTLRNYECLSTKEVYAVEDWYDSGRYDLNLKLVSLRIDPSIKVVKRNWQPDKIRNWLNMMEIKSLNMCRDVGAGLGIKDEEEF